MGFPFGDELEREAREEFVEAFTRARAEAERSGFYSPPLPPAGRPGFHYVGPEKYADKPAPKSRADMREMIARAAAIAKSREEEAECLRRLELAKAANLRKLREEAKAKAKEERAVADRVHAGVLKALRFPTTIGMPTEPLAPPPPPPPSPAELWATHLRAERKVAGDMLVRDSIVRVATRPVLPFERGTWEPSTSGFGGGAVGIWRRR